MPTTGAPLHGRDIVCVGFSDRGKDLLTDEQHLLVRPADGNRTLVVLLGDVLGNRPA